LKAEAKVIIAELDAKAKTISAKSKIEMEEIMYRIKIDHQKS